MTVKDGVCLRVLHYDIIGADICWGVHEHPQTQMKKLGFHVVKSEPCPIADCWFFRVSNDIGELPEYLSDVGNSFKFSDEYRSSEVNSK